MRIYLADDELQVGCEDPVFDAVLQWLRGDADERKEHFEKIVQHVRLPYCSTAFLCHVVQEDERMRSDLCRGLLQEARNFQLQPEHQIQVILSCFVLDPNANSKPIRCFLQFQLIFVVCFWCFYPSR